MSHHVPWRAAIALLVVGLSSAGAMAETRTLTGEVTYRERMALPPTAEVEVELLDVSLADVPAIPIAKTTVTPGGQVPFQFALRYDDAKIDPTHRYGLRARITVDGRLWFTSTMHHPVLSSDTEPTNILVQRVTDPARAGPSTPEGSWLAEDIGGGGVIDRLQSVLEISADGVVTGTGGCNRMNGRATVTGEKITFGPIASTRMACTPAAMEQESKFFAALREVREWRIDPTRQKLVLLNGQGKPVAVFAKM